MNKENKICPDCDRENPSDQKKCQYCGAVLHYGKDYYKFKSFLSWVSIFGILTATIYTSLSTSNMISPTFFENLPNWVSYIFWGFGDIGILCLLLVRLADLDEIFNE